MPTHSSSLSEPSYWENPPAPSSWWPIIREAMPAYDRDLTPTRGMGAIPETFRKQSGAVRSGHPQVSFAARGPDAAFVTAEHSLEHGLGERSPLARVYELDGSVLLLGVGHDSDTSLHLAEYRAEFAGKRIIRQGAPVAVDGRRAWLEFDDLDLRSSDFAPLGDDFARDTGAERTGLVARASARLVPQRTLVDYAVGWLARNRRPGPQRRRGQYVR